MSQKEGRKQSYKALRAFKLFPDLNNEKKNLAAPRVPSPFGRSNDVADITRECRENGISTSGVSRGHGRAHLDNRSVFSHLISLDSLFVVGSAFVVGVSFWLATQ